MTPRERREAINRLRAERSAEDEARIQAKVDATVAAAPPLSQEQRDILRTLLKPSRGESEDVA